MGRKVDVDDLVSLAEVTERRNLTSREAVRSWRQRYSEFPQPVASSASASSSTGQTRELGRCDGPPVGLPSEGHLTKEPQ